MKHFVTTIIFSFWCLLACAQQDHFIYLQTENRQPFFVKLDGKVLNSSPSGYLIIPKLIDGVYSLVIGFPGNTLEEEFNCSINKKDVGYIIKNIGEQQWQLLNVQTLNVIVPGDVITKQVIVYEKETDLFSTMLANAVNDSTILQKEVVKNIPREKVNEPVNKDSTNAVNSNPVADHTLVSNSGKSDNSISVIPISEKINEKSKNDTAGIVVSTNNIIIKPDNVLANDSTIKNEEASEIVTKKPAVIGITKKGVPISKSGKKKTIKKSANKIEEPAIDQKVAIKEIIAEKTDQSKDSIQGLNSNIESAIVRSIIKRKFKKPVKDGIEMMYVDDDGDTKDTIKILITSEKKKKNVEEIKIAEPIGFAPKSQWDSIANVEKNDKAKFKISKQEKQIIKEANNELLVKSSMPNSDCKSIATDEDFLKLRKKIVAEDNDENMIKAAKKVFKIKCFTTEQIKNVSVLFLVEQSKYMFFEAAYPFVSDSDFYYILEKQLSDNNYITKFRMMIHK